MISLAIHSHKGGVGKTTIAVNMAVLLAKQGKNVCLIDFDFVGPNLYTFFEETDKKYLNEYFWNSAPLEDCLFNVKDELKLVGNLYLGLGDPATESMNAVIELDSNGAMKMLQDSFKIKNALKKKPFDIDYFILDTTPGLALATVNSFLVTDNILFIIKFSNADINGTIHLISGLLDSLTNETAIIANNIPVQFLQDKKEQKRIEEKIVDKIKDKTGVEIDFLGWLQRDDDLQVIEYMHAVKHLDGLPTDRIIHALTQPEHPIVTCLEKIITKIK